MTFADAFDRMPENMEVSCTIRKMAKVIPTISAANFARSFISSFRAILNIPSIGHSRRFNGHAKAQSILAKAALSQLKGGYNDLWATSKQQRWMAGSDTSGHDSCPFEPSTIDRN
jgi:hypothetical protein